VNLGTGGVIEGGRMGYKMAEPTATNEMVPGPNSSIAR
jgi:hypothetical protein